MILWLLLAVQTPAPDIELDVRLTARRLEIQPGARASLAVRANPNGGSAVSVDAPRTGQRALQNVAVRVQAQARVAPPPARPALQEETTQESPR